MVNHASRAGGRRHKPSLVRPAMTGLVRVASKDSDGRELAKFLPVDRPVEVVESGKAK